MLRASDITSVFGGAVEETEMRQVLASERITVYARHQIDAEEAIAALLRRAEARILPILPLYLVLVSIEFAQFVAIAVLGTLWVALILLSDRFFGDVPLLGIDRRASSVKTQAEGNGARCLAFLSLCATTVAAFISTAIGLSRGFDKVALALPVALALAVASGYWLRWSAYKKSEGSHAS